MISACHDMNSNNNNNDDGAGPGDGGDGLDRYPNCVFADRLSNASKHLAAGCSLANCLPSNQFQAASSSIKKSLSAASIVVGSRTPTKHLKIKTKTIIKTKTETTKVRFLPIKASSIRSNSGSDSNKTLASTYILFIVVLATALVVFDVSFAEAVVVHQVRIEAGGRTDYALTGDSALLSCHFLMKDDVEDVKQLVWSKDGKNILRWRKTGPGLEVLSYTFKGRLGDASNATHVHLRNVTAEMAGAYKCAVRTDLGAGETEPRQVIVIARDACADARWISTTSTGECKESLRFDCRRMFPKPAPSCGLWDARRQKYIASVPLDVRPEQLQDIQHRGADNSSIVVPNTIQTFRVHFANSFWLSDEPHFKHLLAFAGHLHFRCELSVPDTSWRLTFERRLFGFADGCLQDPLDFVESLRTNYSIHIASAARRSGLLRNAPNDSNDDFEMLATSLRAELLPPPVVGGDTGSNQTALSCWRRARVGARARLSCAGKTHTKLVGNSLLECKPSGNWAPVSPLADTSTSTKVSSNGRRRQRLVADGKELASNEIDADAVDNDNSSTTPPVSSSPFPPPSSITTTTTTATTTQSTLTTPRQTPSQLAALLPTCVSTRRRHPPAVNSKAALLDERRSGAGRPQPAPPPPPISVYHFSLADSSSAITTSPSSIMLLLIASILLITMMKTNSMRTQLRL